MGKLYKRMLRQVKAAKGQFFSVVIIIAIGAAIFAGMFASVGGMTGRLDEYYSEQNLADSWLYFRGISQDEMEALLAGEPDILAEGRYTYDARLTVNSAESELRIRSLSGINSTDVSEGRLPEAVGEILVDAKYYSENKLAIGDTLYLHTEDGDFAVIITGVGHNPEAVLIQKDAFSASVSHRAFGLGYATPETLIALNKTTVLYHELAQDIEDALAEARQALEDGEAEIAEGEAEYSDAVLAAEQAAAEGRRELESARQAICFSSLMTRCRRVISRDHAEISDQYASPRFPPGC